MSIWLLIVLFAAIKVPLAALMLWLPFREDSALQEDDQGSNDGGDDGGIKDPVDQPRGPHPRSPRRWPRRRGPHGSPSSPSRVRWRHRIRRRPRVPAGR